MADGLKPYVRERYEKQVAEWGAEVYAKRLALLEKHYTGDWLKDQETKFEKLGLRFGTSRMVFTGTIKNATDDQLQRWRAALKNFNTSKWSTPEGQDEIAAKAYKTMTEGRYNKQGEKVSEGSYKNISMDSFKLMRTLFSNRNLMSMREYYHFDSDQIIQLAMAIEKGDYQYGIDFADATVSNILRDLSYTRMYTKGTLSGQDIIDTVKYFSNTGFDLESELTRREQINEYLKASRNVSKYRFSAKGQQYAGRRKRDYYEQIAYRYSKYKAIKTEKKQARKARKKK